MKKNFAKITALSLVIMSCSAFAETKTYQCPNVQGNYAQDEAVGDWFFWADKGEAEIKVTQWSGQNVRHRSGKYYNLGLVCSAGTEGNYYGFMLPVKAKSCVEVGRGKFSCD